MFLLAYRYNIDLYLMYRSFYNLHKIIKPQDSLEKVSDKGFISKFSLCFKMESTVIDKLGQVYAMGSYLINK